jgi:hypothetical protein
MKKLVFSLIFFSLLVGGVMAQKNLTSTQKNFQNSIISFLREEGYSPSIDSDGWIAFKNEGKTFWVGINSESPFFVVFSRSGFRVGGDDGYEYVASLWSCNEVNKELKAVKMYCNGESVSLQIEQYTRSAEDFKYVFYKNLSSLTSASKLFIEKYDEWEKK